jgi:O-antigen ligase
MIRLKTHSLPKTILITFWLLSVISLLFVCAIGPIVSSDSRAYFGMWPYVSAGYPFFLRGLHKLLGENYPNITVAFQFLAVISSIYLFMSAFLMQFQLKVYQLLLLLLLLFYPIFDSNLWVVNNVSTEGLSYSLFLLIITSCYSIFVKRELRRYVVLLVLTTLLLTIRGQFKFLIPLFLFMELVLQYKKRKLSWKAIIVIFTIPLLTYIIDVSYHRVVQKQFFTTPFTWTTLVSSVLFVSDESDVQFVNTEEARIVFNRIHGEFRTKKIGYKDHKYFKEPIDYNYVFFHYEYPTICNQTVQRVAVKYFEEQHQDKIKAYLDTERVHKQLFFDLMPHTFTKWISLAFQSFKSGIGGLTIAIVYIVCVVMLLNYYSVSGNKMLLFAGFLLLVILANKVLVSITVHSIIRYFFYTNWIPIFLLFLGINTLKSKQN